MTDYQETIIEGRIVGGIRKSMSKSNLPYYTFSIRCAQGKGELFMNCAIFDPQAVRQFSDGDFNEKDRVRATGTLAWNKVKGRLDLIVMKTERREVVSTPIPDVSRFDDDLPF